MSALSFDDAVDIWLAKWKHEYVQAIAARYRVNHFRLYEIWEELVHPGSREMALERLQKEAPTLAASVNTSPHKRTRMVVPRGQLDLFPAD